MFTVPFGSVATSIMPNMTILVLLEMPEMPEIPHFAKPQ
jgi:hypothetical protein